MTKNFDPRIPILIIILAAMSLMTSSHAYAAVTRTADAVTINCNGTKQVSCTGPTTTQTYKDTCSTCGMTTFSRSTTKCTYCNSGEQVSTHYYHCACDTGYTPGSSAGQNSSGSIIHGYKYVSPCTHGQSSPHSISTGSYSNAAYGYGGTSSTFTVYGITTNYGSITEKPTVSYKATGATATDYFLAGKTITMTLKNTTGMELTVDYNSTKEIVAIGETYTRTFTMPAQDITVNVDYNKLPQYISIDNLLINTVFNSVPISIDASVIAEEVTS